MRTTIRMDDDLLREAKALAARTDRTLTEVIQDAVRAELARRDEVGEGGPVQLPTSPGAPRPGVDLDDSAGLLEIMETEGDRQERSVS